jgi:hypothetical protein
LRSSAFNFIENKRSGGLFLSLALFGKTPEEKMN